MKRYLMGAILLPVAAALLGAGAAAAQAPPSGENEQEITVTGRNERLTTTLKSVLSETGFGQIGRYEDPVCPGVTGLPENHAAVVVGLIRSNAEQAGLRLKEEGCRPNAVAIFTADPAALVKGLKTRDRSMFGEMSDAEIDALAATAGPVISWRGVETRSHDGSMPNRADSVNGETVAGRGPLVIRNAMATRNAENVRQDIRMSIAAIEAPAIRGKTLQQLADFATLHLFLDLDAQAARAAGRSSILSLFDTGPGAAPAALTAFDKGMLKGLYGDTKNNVSSSQRRGAIVREIGKALNGSE